MSLRMCVVVVVGWLASLFVVGTLARAQAFQFSPLPEPIVVSGEDVGFRVEGWLGAAAAGRLVVRVDGRWVEAQDAPASRLRPVH